MKIRPLYDRVAVRQPKPDEFTPGGLVIPKTVGQDDRVFLRGVVAFQGPGRVDERGAPVPMQSKIGDQVVFSKYAGTPMILNEGKIDEEQYFILKDGDILAVLEEEPPVTVESILGHDSKVE